MTEADNIPVIDDELDTTVPQSDPPAWKMPEPIFRRTSGKLPKVLAEENRSVPSSELHDTPEAPALAAPEVRPKSSALKLVVVVLAFAAMIAFLIVFMTVLYFFFLRDAAPPT